MKSISPGIFARSFALASACVLFASGCGGGGGGSAAPDPAVNPAHLTASTLSVNPSIVGNNLSKGSITVSNADLYYSNLQMVQFNQGWSGKVVNVPIGHFNATNDFGPNGSMTLVADALNYPISGGAYPILTGFKVVLDSDGTTVDYVSMTSGCSSSGMYSCSGGTCSAQAGCTVTNGSSSYGSQTDWSQHQVPPFGYTSTNTFPHCDSTVNSWSSCPSNLGSLPSGTYSAQYVLMSNSGDSVDDLRTGLRVHVVTKRDSVARNPGSGSAGGLNLNVILVGNQNISDAHTQKGANNLNYLLREVNQLYSQTTGTKVGLNQVQFYEWADGDGGSQYSEVDLDSLGDLFEAGSKGVTASDEGNFINIFIVSDIQCSSCGGFSVLGLSGAILGPPKNGTQTSGLAFATFNELASFNPGCPDAATTCSRSALENDFLEMGATIVHELGHFLGLNHPSEKPDSSGVQANDALSDTPTCAYRTVSSNLSLDQRACYYVDHTTQTGGSSCLTACDTETGATHYLGSSSNPRTIEPWSTVHNIDMPAKFCPLTQACQFNHVMWYTTKNRMLLNNSGNPCSLTDATNGICTWSEDGNLMSPQSSAIVQWDPFLR